MSKPLTIDELKALEVGEWVWMSDLSKSPRDISQYVCVRSISNRMFNFDSIGCLSGILLNNYGTEWLAYKNKEQAEAKGEIIELPCLRDKPVIYYHGEPILRKELNYMTKDGTICSESFSEDEFEQAEARLRELQDKCYSPTPQMIAEADCKGECANCDGKAICWKEDK